MAEPAGLVRAQLIELDADFRDVLPGGRCVRVQFNPETLKVTFANQITQGSGAGDQNGTQARQFVGAGTTKLALQLWFDVTSSPGGVAGQEQDVRRLTQKVAYFITPNKLPPAPPGPPPPSDGGGGNATPQPEYAPPAVRFIWGSFQFDGIMEQLEESLEFWSPEGLPLRASVSIGLTQQKITEFAFAKTGAGAARRGAAAGATPGTRPLVQAPAGASVQGLASAAGAGGSWQAVAAANGIEDPLRLQPGTLLDLSLRTRR